MLVLSYFVLFFPCIGAGLVAGLWILLAISTYLIYLEIGLMLIIVLVTGTNIDNITGNWYWYTYQYINNNYYQH